MHRPGQRFSPTLRSQTLVPHTSSQQEKIQNGRIQKFARVYFSPQAVEVVLVGIPLPAYSMGRPTCRLCKQAHEISLTGLSHHRDQSLVLINILYAACYLLYAICYIMSARCYMLYDIC